MKKTLSTLLTAAVIAGTVYCLRSHLVDSGLSIQNSLP